MSDDLDYARVFFGQNARHVPTWMYVQDAGPGMVSFVGGSRVDALTHPLRYGSQRTHQFVVGELVVRPHWVVATDALKGMGLAGLAIAGHDVEEMLAEGEFLITRGGSGEDAEVPPQIRIAVPAFQRIAAEIREARDE